MPYEISWYIEHRVIYAQVSGIMTMKDVCHFNQDLVANVESGTPPVYLIMHHDDMEKIPSNLRHVRRALTVLDHDSMGLIVDVNANTSVWTYVGQMLVRMSRVPFRHVNSLEKAYQLLAEYDPSLVEALESITT